VRNARVEFHAFMLFPGNEATASQRHNAVLPVLRAETNIYLEIPIDYALGVKVPDGADHLGAVEAGCGLLEGAAAVALVHVVVEIAAARELRHEAQQLARRESILQLLGET
jgi:hypothetical protein